MVYELTSPEGDVYRMQSYTQLVDPTLTIDDLETLGERLELPEGWRYQARVLGEDSQLVADGLAFVINDDFLNAYQKITEPTSGQSQAPQILANQPTPSPNESGIYTTIAAFEHGDAGRQHVFNTAVFTGDTSNPSSNRVSTRTTPETYPGIYNLVTRNPNELFVYFGSYGDMEEATGPTLARLDATSLEEVWRTPVTEITPPSWNYPGVVGLHGNGDLYVVAGNIIAKIDPDTGEILNTNTLPSENPDNSTYNGFATSSDGTCLLYTSPSPRDPE